MTQAHILCRAWDYISPIHSGAGTRTPRYKIGRCAIDLRMEN